MRLEVTPAIDRAAEQALRVALAEVREPSEPTVSVWHKTARREAVERGGYALSPRRTRGATRA